MSTPSELGPGGRVAISLCLTAVGGFVDAVGYIALFQIFTANMSGNSIHIGILLSQQSWNGMTRFAWAVVAYVSGMVLTRITVEAGARAGFRHIAMVTLTVEAALLALFAHARPAMHLGAVIDQRSPAYFLLIALLAFAMGVQTATLTHVGTLTVYTTFVTGTLTKFTESFTRALFWVYDNMRQPAMSHIAGQRDVQETAMLAFTWMCYVLGAASGALLKSRWELRALYLPVCVLVLFIVVDYFRPLAVEEEKAQAR